MALVIGDQELQAINLTAEELRLEIAIWFYQTGKMSSGQASKFANVSRVQFQKELGQRKVPVNYGIEDFEQDMQTIQEAKN